MHGIILRRVNGMTIVTKLIRIRVLISVTSVPLTWVMHLTTNIGNLSFLAYTFLSHLLIISYSCDNDDDGEDHDHGYPISLKTMVIQFF